MKPLGDLDKMPFGKYKDFPMEKVPSQYFHWLWTEGGMKDYQASPVADYIRRNLATLIAEYPDGLWESTASPAKPADSVLPTHPTPVTTVIDSDIRAAAWEYTQPAIFPKVEHAEAARAAFFAGAKWMEKKVKGT